MMDYGKDSLQLTLNLIPAHVWYADASGALTFVNERCADYLGLASDDPLRFGAESHMAWDSHVTLLHPDDHEETRRIWAECIKSRSAGDVAFRVRNAEGGYRWFLSRAEPRWTSDGELQGWIGINLDIDEQRQSEFYLQEGQRLMKAGSWVFSGEEFEYWSPSMFHLYGIDPSGRAPTLSECLGFLHPDDRVSMNSLIRRIVDERRGFDFTKRIARRDGSVRLIRWVGTPTADGGPEPRFIGICLDVTEHEQLAADLRNRESEYRQIVDLVPQPAALVGADGQRFYANRSALDYLGISFEEWLIEPLGNSIHGDDKARFLAFQKRLSTPQVHDIELRLLKKNGDSRWFLCRYNPLSDEAGQLARWYITCTDIEDQKRLEERLRRENIALREEIDQTSMFEEIVGTSAALKEVLSRVTKVAATDATVLVMGETGTGKELIARAIHRRSRRACGAFVAVNCAAIPKELIASELFGHEKGGFTGATQRRTGRFEIAEGGTIFLDEIGELSLDTQIALLRVLQEREFERVGGRTTIQANVRVIAATNRDLNQAIAAGTFREDLFYRLHVFPLDLPPLRERREDIPLLVEYFINRLARNEGKKFKSINRNTLNYLESYRWPGNVRELQNVIERSVIVCDSEDFSIDKSWLAGAPSAGDAHVLSNALLAHEKTIIEDALRICNGRVYGPFGAAARLGLPRSTLESKIRALKIDKRRFRQKPPGDSG